MKHLTAAATALVTLTTAGCSAGGAYKPIARLDCPQSQSGLTRVSEAADGKSCGYVSDDGAKITLKLVPVSVSVDATLAKVEADLRQEIAAGAPDAAGAAKPAADTAAVASDAAPGGSTAADAAAVRAQAEADAHGFADRADDREAASSAAEKAVDEASTDADWDADWDKGDAQRGGDHTRVDLPGVHIVADERNDSAQVRVGPIHIDANGDSAEIRMKRDVRLKGEALSRSKNGVRATFILAGDEIGGGYKYAGYEAGGPRKGPLAVAVVKGRENSGDHDEIYDAVKKLVRRNGGV